MYRYSKHSDVAIFCVFMCGFPDNSTSGIFVFRSEQVRVVVWMLRVWFQTKWWTKTRLQVHWNVLKCQLLVHYVYRVCGHAVTTILVSLYSAEKKKTVVDSTRRLSKHMSYHVWLHMIGIIRDHVHVFLLSQCVCGCSLDK